MIGEKHLTQAQKFEQAARKLDCDDSEEAFDAKPRAIAKPKPKDEPMTERVSGARPRCAK